MAAYAKNKKTFVNPYNFVKLGNSCKRKRDYLKEKEASDAISGWLECELELKSPVFIPNSSNKHFFGEWHSEASKKEELKSYEFYSYDDLKDRSGESGENKTTEPPQNPVIPGSEIRGVIRSAFEALTNSCLSTIDPKMPFHKRAPKSNCSGKPGILRKNGDGWEIQPCKRYMIKTKTRGNDRFIIPIPPDKWLEKLRECEVTGKEVRFAKTQPYKKRIRHMEKTIGDAIQDNILSYSSPNATVGKIHITADFTRKHHDSVFVETNDPAIPITKEEAENYLANLEECIKSEFGKEYKHLDKGKNINMYNNVCVYYTEYGEKRYLSPSMINREMLYAKLGERIGNYHPCSDSKNLCNACSLFGMVSDTGSVSSRLRFGDAVPVDNTYGFMPPVLLDELAGPKPSATEFYLERPENMHNWNYDYQMKWEGNQASFAKYNRKIRGRKFYWHHKFKPNELLKKHDLDKNEKDKLLRMVLVRPLKSGKFTFKVYFDHVARADVYKLIYVLTIGFSSDNAHKIGMGKPLGLGSVQIKANKMVRRMINDECQREESFADLQGEDCIKTLTDYCHKILCSNDSDPEIMNQFKDLTKLNHDYDVRYPYVIEEGKEQPEHYKWFVGNKQISDIGKANNPVIDQSLADPKNPKQNAIEIIVENRSRR